MMFKVIVIVILTTAVFASNRISPSIPDSEWEDNNNNNRDEWPYNIPQDEKVPNTQVFDDDGLPTFDQNKYRLSPYTIEEQQKVEEDSNKQITSDELEREDEFELFNNRKDNYDYKSIGEDDDKSDDFKMASAYFAVVDPYFGIELAYRLDVVNCPTRDPSPNHAYVYYAKVHYNRGKLWCRSFLLHTRKLIFHARRNSKNKIMAIEPERGISDNYFGRILEQYNVVCSSGKNCQLDITNTDIQPPVKIGLNLVCIDYIKVVDFKTNHVIEVCGNETKKYTFNDTILITFRTGRFTERSGFTILVTEFEQAIAANCLDSTATEMDNTYMYGIAIKNDLQVEKKLLQFYADNYNTVPTALTALNKNTLRLANIATKSCNSALAVIAEAVESLFMEEDVLQAKMEYYKK